MRSVWLGVLALSLTATVAAKADPVTYVYTGNAFTTVNGPYTTADAITGSVTLDAPLGANLYAYEVPYWDIVSFDFTDGVEEFDEANKFYPYFGFSTDANGEIIRWFVNISTPSTTIQFCTDCSYTPPEDSAQDGYGTLSGNTNEPGTWTVEGSSSLNDVAIADAPEPDALLLALTGVVGILPVMRGAGGRKRG
jgi:hypothetical protein